MAANAQQPATATLSGRVTDPQGAVIVGAQITATSKATGIERTTKTNDQGLFALTNLAPGEYEVKTDAAGFKSLIYADVVIAVGQNATLDISLRVGEIEIILDKGGPFGINPIDTTSSVVEGVINSPTIENLPLNGRNFLELALLVPGNAPAPNFDPTKTNTVVISSAGQLGRGGNVTVDGADNNDDVVGGPLQNISQEAVQEFQIATNRFSAELGRSGSSVINIVTKSGTNEFHGSASFYFRDQKLQGLPATFDRSNPMPPFDREQYAFALGGSVKRDRAWWFGSFEYRNQDGTILVGERDTATRTIKRAFAAAPLNDLLATARGDWRLSDLDSLTFRYSIERADDIAASTLIRAIGSASQRQDSSNHYQTFLTNYTRLLSPRAINNFSFSVNNFINRTVPVTPGPQLTFPSLQDGASFRVPQQTRQNRLQFSDTFSLVAGAHDFCFGGQVQRIDADFNLGVFQQGRIELVQDFPDFDHNGDGRVDDNDLLFAVTLRSATPARPLIIPDADNTHFAFFFQDNWRVTPQLTLNLGLRYELDTDVKNVSRTDELNPIILPFLSGTRRRDKNNFGPRVGFNWATRDGRTSIHGGYGIYYDRVTLEIQSLERGLDGRALAIEVRAGNIFFIDPNTDRFPPFAPNIANPFTGFILPGAGAAGINIIDNRLENPMVQQMNFGIQGELASHLVVRADYLHNFGTHFIIGRLIGTVFNPVVGGPDGVVNLESSVKTKYDGLLVSVEKRISRGYMLRASYTLSKAFNYANDDQIPFAQGPIDPNNLQLEYGPTPNDQRHRFTFSGLFELPGGFRLAPIWTVASSVPMDILLPDASTRIPLLQRNAGGRVFHTGAELNAFIRQINAGGGINGKPLPMVRDDARFNDSFNSSDLRVSRPVRLNERAKIEPAVEVFNLFNVTNVLGASNVNYSGFSNALVRDSNDERSPGFLRSSSFGRPVTTAGGVFGSGGPRAFQLAVRFTF
ncbi:MAG TPA: carboxypeptidase regulatory-like domain-containing protein [Blastocatellia bacterium]|nr:carboxypeptidase regulatory-like domain-containing protein [Blastocatellia bacterium]